MIRDIKYAEENLGFNIAKLFPKTNFDDKCKNKSVCMTISLRIIIFVLFFSVSLFSQTQPYYGSKTLVELREYGIEVRVSCSPELAQFKTPFTKEIEKRLKRKRIQVFPSSNVVLKLIAHAISSDDGFYIIHFTLELAQGAHLDISQKYVEAPTWDAVKMGEYKADELLAQVDDLARIFVNDYLSRN